MKFIQVKFKGAAPGGFDGYGALEVVGEKQLENFQKSGQYDIEIIGDKVVEEVVEETIADNNPNKDWTVKEIKAYLDDNNIEYTGTHDTKAKLLALI